MGDRVSRVEVYLDSDKDVTVGQQILWEIPVEVVGFLKTGGGAKILTLEVAS